MFSDAISSISWRCRPSSPRIAAAISGSASVRPAVKNESGAEAVFALEDEELMGEKSPPPQPVTRVQSVCVAVEKMCSRDSTSARNGQGLAVQACYLCKIWWGCHPGSPAAIPRRDAPGLCKNLPPKKTEGVGNAGCPLHPQPRAQSVVTHTSVVTTGPPESPGIPTRNGFNGLSRALPGDEFVLSPSSAD